MPAVRARFRIAAKRSLCYCTRCATAALSYTPRWDIIQHFGDFEYKWHKAFVAFKDRGHTRVRVYKREVEYRAEQRGGARAYVGKTGGTLYA